MKRIVYLLVGLLVIGLVEARAVPVPKPKIINVPFNGQWQNGATLYTDWVCVSSTQMYGKDVYAIGKSRRGCMNPDGSYTNQLKLMNFKYTTDGVNWNTIPYLPKAKYVTGCYQFKVDIPDNCIPSYDINKAIYLVKY